MNNIDPSLIKPYMSAQALEYVEALESAINESKKAELTGCEYCNNGGKSYPVTPCGNGDLGARASFLTGSIVLCVHKTTASGFFDIAYCPMCGKELNFTKEGQL